MAALLRHPWPGNVRELENVVERAVTLTGAGQIVPEALLLDAALNPATDASLAQLSGRPTLRELGEEYVNLVLREVGGDKARAAEILGISKRTLYRWDRHPAAFEDEDS
jgi:transcriptional regulator with PAS, ATPase and Fis domain